MEEFFKINIFILIGIPAMTRKDFLKRLQDESPEAFLDC